MPHPSQELVTEAAERIHSGDLAAIRERHRREAGIFRAEAEFDMDGLRQATADLAGPHTILPPQPPGWRGRLGRWLIDRQVAVAWWLVRALGLRDNAIQSMQATLLRQTRIRAAREIELYRRVQELECKVIALERQLKDSGRP